MRSPDRPCTSEGDWPGTDDSGAGAAMSGLGAAFCPPIPVVLTSTHLCQAARPAGAGALQLSGRNGGATSASTLRIQGSAARLARSGALDTGFSTVPGSQSNTTTSTTAAAGRLSREWQRHRADRATGARDWEERQERKVIIWRGGVNKRQTDSREGGRLGAKFLTQCGRKS